MGTCWLWCVIAAWQSKIFKMLDHPTFDLVIRIGRYLLTSRAIDTPVIVLVRSTVPRDALYNFQWELLLHLLPNDWVAPWIVVSREFSNALRSYHKLGGNLLMSVFPPSHAKNANSIFDNFFIKRLTICCTSTISWKKFIYNLVGHQDNVNIKLFGKPLGLNVPEKACFWICLKSSNKKITTNIKGKVLGTWVQYLSIATPSIHLISFHLFARHLRFRVRL